MRFVASTRHRRVAPLTPLVGVQTRRFKHVVPPVRVQAHLLDRLLALVAMGMVLLSARAEAQGALGTIRGIIVDRAGGTPLSGITVTTTPGARTTVSDADGQFSVHDLPSGAYHLAFAVADLHLGEQVVNVSAGATTNVTVALDPGQAALAQSVTVSGTGATHDAAVGAAAHDIAARELQALRSTISNDPFRAIQILPGVATGDDLRSEFTVRGHASEHLLFTFDGVAAPLLVHTVQRIVDSGSLAMVNGDVLESVTLANGSYPQRHGNRLGAAIDFRVRPGARDRLRLRLSASGTDSGVIGEGPVGRVSSGAARGSWLVSVRKSYLGLVTSRVDTGVDFSFGFVDAQAKLAYDVSPAHHVEVAMLGGRSKLTLSPVDLSNDDPQQAHNASALALVSWRSQLSPRATLTQRTGVTFGEYRNTNLNRVELARGTSLDLLYRAELLATFRPWLTLDTGGEVRQSEEAGRAIDFVTASRVDPRLRFDGHARTHAGYAQATFEWRGWVVRPGVRLDNWTYDARATVAPWAFASRTLSPRLTLSVSAGAYDQRPTLDQLVGLRGAPTLHSEQATHVDIGATGRLAGAWRWQVTVFGRDERDGIRLPGTEYRVVGTTLQVPSFVTRYRNGLTGRTRGADVVVERRSAGRLSGWVAYTYAESTYRDDVSGESYDGDYDQRHTVNAFATVALSARTSVTMRFREGSSMPAPGYWEPFGRGYTVGTARNRVRVPLYARLDARVGHTMRLGPARLTVFGEVLNALDRRNVRAVSPSVNRRTREVTDLFSALFPRVPSAGVTIDF